MTTAQLLAAIQDYFADTSRSPEETAEGLDEAAELIESLKGSL